ncbi:hypothetical protein [Oligoflexus tunisiensis]|uniref:hypothetical protein n=1 Tax=Oligoflexus tunisiensis TaxID=708132 RepID=UPI00114D26E9|nr:hypothetical protein [Oligoflexus tunisiensis]
MNHFLLSIILIFLPACNPVMNNFIAAKKEDDANAKKNQEADAEAERVDVPNNIAGSYLMCSLRKDASPTDPASEYGCRLNEAGTVNRLDLSPYLSRISWTSNQAEGVTITSNPADSVWHALYLVSASDVNTVREKAARLQVQVQWATPDGSAQSTVKDQRLIDTLQPADAAGDTSAPVLQGQGLDPTDPGTL